MEIQFNSSTSTNDQTEKPIESIALGRMITKLVSQFQPTAVLRQSLIVNDVPTGFYVDTDENVLATVVTYLFNTVVNKTKNSCIRISAKRYNSIVLLRMSDASGAIDSMSNHNWHEMQTMAEKIGGCIIADDIRKKPSNITFSFRCLADAA